MLLVLLLFKNEEKWEGIHSFLWMVIKNDLKVKNTSYYIVTITLLFQIASQDINLSTHTFILNLTVSF